MKIMATSWTKVAKASVRAATVGIPIMLLVATLPAYAATAANACGTTILPLSGSPSSSIEGFVTYRATFIDQGAHCGLETWNWIIGGTSYNGWGTYWIDGNNYVLEAKIDTDLGTQKVEIRVVEKCGTGNCAGANNIWTNTVMPNCGNDPLIPDTATQYPTGEVTTATPRIGMKFIDGNYQCGLHEAVVTVNGKRIGVEEWGSEYGIYYTVAVTPSAPLTWGKNVVRVDAYEKCCNSLFGRNTGSSTWSFYVDLCGKAPLTASHQSPEGMTSNPNAVVSVKFTDTDKPCDLQKITMMVDGFGRDYLYTKPTAGEHVISWQVVGPFTPGPHHVSVDVLERDSANKGFAEWTFTTNVDYDGHVVYNDYLPGAEVEESTPHSLDKPRQCYTQFQLCVGPFSAPVPATVGVHLDVDPSHLVAEADPSATDTYGPYDLTVVTPIGPLPVTFCATPDNKPACELPTPSTGETVYEGKIVLTLDANGESQTIEHPFSIQIPKTL